MARPEVLLLPTYKHLVYLCRNQEQFDWVCNKYECHTSRWLKNRDSAATTTWLGSANVIIVSLPYKKLTAKQAAFAAHEAVHVGQFIFQAVGESNPGDETEAYLVEQVTEFLLGPE